MLKLELDGLDDPRAAEAVDMLESDGLVVFPTLPFPLDPAERPLLDPSLLKPRTKNISLDTASDRLGGARGPPKQAAALKAMLKRYADFADRVMAAIAPRYVSQLQRGRVTFRPGPVDSRVLSARRDDRRLHLDAFAGKPVQGRRILRLFTNVDPEGRDRVWEIGAENVAAQARRCRQPKFIDGGLATRMQERLGLIRGRRTAYDAAMLTLHDAAKLDADWQATAARTRIGFGPGATWAVFTDSAAHAALSGQHAFEQTWLLPVQAMAEPERSPLRRLEAIAGRALT